MVPFAVPILQRYGLLQAYWHWLCPHNSIPPALCHSNYLGYSPVQENPWKAQRPHYSSIPPTHNPWHRGLSMGIGLKHLSVPVILGFCNGPLGSSNLGQGSNWFPSAPEFGEPQRCWTPSFGPQPLPKMHCILPEHSSESGTLALQHPRGAFPPSICHYPSLLLLPGHLKLR